MTPVRRLFAALAGLAAVTLAAPAAAQEPAPQQKVKYERYRIVREEIDAKVSDAKTAYDIIQRLRPQFLRVRPSGSIQNRTPVPVKVYVNGALMGDTSSLQNIIAESVREIEYLNGRDATTRFGTDHENGAILVRTGAR